MIGTGIGNAVMDTTEIRELLPHRYPMLLVDRVLTADPGKQLVATKAITANEPWFAETDDFVYPPALLMESWGQSAGVLALLTNRETRMRTGMAMLFGSALDVGFHRPARPGDVVEHEVWLVRDLGDTMIFEGMSTVDGELVLTVSRMVMAFRPAERLSPAITGAGR